MGNSKGILPSLKRQLEQEEIETIEKERATMGY